MTNTDKTVSAALAGELHEVAEWLLSSRLSGHEHVAITAAGSLKRAADFLASRTQEPAERMEIGEGWEAHTLEEKQEVQRNAGIPHLPTDMTLEARLAISGRGPRAFEWTDKKHRLVYDLCREIERLAALRAASITPPAPERSKEEVGVTVEALFEHGVTQQTQNYQFEQTGTGAWLFRCDEWLNITEVLTALEPASLHKGEVIGWMRRWAFDGVDVMAIKPPSARPKGWQFHEITRVKVADDDVALYASPAPLPVGGVHAPPDVDNRPFCDCHQEYGEGLIEALEWYGEQARLCRLIHSEGDAGRTALAADGGKRATAALAKPREQG